MGRIRAHDFVQTPVRILKGEGMHRYALLAVENDSKTKKSVPHGVLTGVLYLQPNTGQDVGGVARYNVCPFSTPGCRAACLNKSGRGQMQSAQKGRLRKALLWRDERKLFLDLLRLDLTILEAEAKARGLQPAARLNGTSDIFWEDHGIPQEFPGIVHYDYSKAPYDRIARWNGLFPRNYHITFSWSESAQATVRAQTWLDHGQPVAVVFRGEVPTSWGKSAGLARDYPVVGGDLHDMRFKDGPVIVALGPKGRAKSDQSGFVISWP